MNRLFTGAAVGCIFSFFAIGAPSLAANSVTVSCVNATPSQVDLVIPVFIRNDLTIRHFVCPLLVRKIGPSYVNKLKLDNAERLLTALTEIVFSNHYDNGTTDTAGCKRYTVEQPKSPGGFLGIPFVNSTEKQIVTGVPYGIMFSNGRLFGNNLAPGSDLTGSCLITVDVNDQEGCFEIDTTCIDPSSHLLFADLDNTIAMPSFAQGVIHVGECQGMALASPDPASLMPPSGLQGQHEVTFSWDPAPNAGGYEVQIDTVDATFSHIWAQIALQGTELTATLPGGEGEQAIAHWRVRSLPSNCDYCIGDWVLASCNCPLQADLDADGHLTALDLGALIDVLFLGNPDPKDPSCPATRSDFDCDGYPTALDIHQLIDHLFTGGVGPCDPCVAARGQ